MKAFVLGAGAWGIALANLLTYNKDLEVMLWSRNQITANEINIHHKTSVLYNIPLNKELKAFTDLKSHWNINSNEPIIIVSAIVSHGLRNFLLTYSDCWPKNSKLISATKGLEEDNGKRMTEVISEMLPFQNPKNIAVLSGPNLAPEIAQGKPAATVIASLSSETADFFQKVFHSEAFRVYTSDDVIGVELGGAIKNVIAIASGICVGLDLGDNTIATLAARGIKEISRLGESMGAKAETFAGMAGLGDVIVTCVSQKSRNRAIGVEIGKGREPAEVMIERKSIEGIHTVVALHNLAIAQKVSLPICEAVYAVLFENFKAKDAIRSLMDREPRMENN